MPGRILLYCRNFITFRACSTLDFSFPRRDNLLELTETSKMSFATRHENPFPTITPGPRGLRNRSNCQTERHLPPLVAISPVMMFSVPLFPSYPSNRTPLLAHGILNTPKSNTTPTESTYSIVFSIFIRSEEMFASEVEKYKEICLVKLSYLNLSTELVREKLPLGTARLS